MSYRTSLYSSTKLLIFLWGVHQYINCCGEGDVNKAGREKLVYPEGTFPSGKIFPSQKGQPLNFSKPLIIFFIFLLSHDERKLEGVGEKKKFYPWGEELFSGGCLFWEMPDSSGALPYLFQECPTPRALLALLFLSITLLGCTIGFSLLETTVVINYH